MSKIVDINEFGKLAFAMYNNIELSRRCINSVAKEHSIEIPKIIWKQRVSRGIYFAGKIEETVIISDDELFDIKVETSLFGICSTITVKNKETGQSGMLSSGIEQKSIDKQISRLKEILRHR